MLLEDFHEIYFFGLKNRNRLQEEKKNYWEMEKSFKQTQEGVNANGIAVPNPCC